MYGYEQVDPAVLRAARGVNAAFRDLGPRSPGTLDDPDLEGVGTPFHNQTLGGRVCIPDLLGPTRRLLTDPAGAPVYAKGVYRTGLQDPLRMPLAPAPLSSYVS